MRTIDIYIISVSINFYRTLDFDGTAKLKTQVVDSKRYLQLSSGVHTGESLKYFFFFFQKNLLIYALFRAKDSENIVE